MILSTCALVGNASSIARYSRLWELGSLLFSNQNLAVTKKFKPSPNPSSPIHIWEELLILSRSWLGSINIFIISEIASSWKNLSWYLFEKGRPSFHIISWKFSSKGFLKQLWWFILQIHALYILHRKPDLSQIVQFSWG